jgi:flagellar protein FliO/FliZ
MIDYILRFLILIPMVGGLAWGSLWLWRRTQMGFTMVGTRQRAAHLVDVISLGTNGKLAVVAFGGRDLLIAVSRSQIRLIADSVGGADND